MAYCDRWFGVPLFALLLVGPGCGSVAAPDAGSPPSNEKVTGAAFAGGTRLQAVLAEASDGTASFFHWWDTELGLTCKFEPVEEPEASWRCLPETAATIYDGFDEVFADAQCSRPLVPEAALPAGRPAVVRRVDVQCGIAREFFRPVGRCPAAMVYRKTDAGCVAETPAASEEFLFLEPLPPEAFVTARAVAGTASGRVALGQLSADDGSRAPHGFRDQVGGFDCWPQDTLEGTRCLPMDFGWAFRGVVYSDARCSLPAAVPEQVCGGLRSSLPFVFDGRNAAGAVTSIHRGGARLPQVFQELKGGGCSAGTQAAVGFAVGEPVELGSFVPASLGSATRPSGLVKTVAEVIANTGVLNVARFDELASNTLGGYECTLAATPDGIVRCVPPIKVGDVEYSDDHCTQPVWQSDWDLLSVAHDRIEVGAAPGRITLPSVERVLIGGTPYDGPVYAERAGVCTLVPDVPNTRQPYHRFSGEALLADLPALKIVVR
jgi:hypothetical protein